MVHSFWIRLRNIKIRDLYSGILMLLSLPYALYLKLFRAPFWLICESESEARDNGYWFYRYLCRQTEQPVIYAIRKDSVDYPKVSVLGKVIAYGSLSHWAHYFAAQVNISTQKGGKPNAAICYVLEVYGLLRNRRVFLQHGITLSDAEWLYYKNTKMRLFICGAKPEYDYVRSRFGYPEGHVAYLGFCRFDNLIHPPRQGRRRIVIMPSWRSWLVNYTQMTKETAYSGNFTESEYYIRWMEVLNAPWLKELLEDCGAELLFFPHRNMQQFLDDFKVDGRCVQLASWKEYDVQELLIESDLLITDYSSVALDYAYQKKPVIFYQFDYEKFRKGQYREGYFRYDDLGPVCLTEAELAQRLRTAVAGGYRMSGEQNAFVDRFFPLRDTNNCERTHLAIRALLDKGGD